ncbi:MAG TPA: 5'-methylthioadenosine/S-adenosylhomocysteine nucleosidase [Pyrinomonadaceae bacterium]|jgi:adenosylhomocysteine nucleosidase
MRVTYKPTPSAGLRLLPAALLLLFVCAAPAAAAPRYDLLVQGAVDSELQPLLAALEGKREVQLDAWTFWTGRIAGRRVVISRTEVGPLNAGAATAVGIRYFRPRAVINQGTAGGHNRALRLWDIIVGERTTDFSGLSQTHGDEGAGVRLERWGPLYNRLRLDGRERVEFKSFAGDPALVQAALRVPYGRGRVAAGNVGSAFRFSRELDLIDWVRHTYGTDSEDMESAYAGGVAIGMHVPFVAVRIISNTEWEHPTFERVAGQYGAEFVLAFIRDLPKGPPR